MPAHVLGKLVPVAASVQFVVRLDLFCKCIEELRVSRVQKQLARSNHIVVDYFPGYQHNLLIVRTENNLLGRSFTLRMDLTPVERGELHRVRNHVEF